MTQKERVLLHLRTQEKVCVASVPLDLGYTLRNRVGELRREDYQIVSERCMRHHHDGPVIAYRLILPQPAQMAML
jgi:hypothetical protein